MFRVLESLENGGSTPRHVFLDLVYQMKSAQHTQTRLVGLVFHGGPELYVLIRMMLTSPRASSFTQDDASAAVRNLLQSLSGGQGGMGGGQSEETYPYLTHLLPKEETLPVLETASGEYIDSLLGLLPPAIVMLAAGSGTSASITDPSPDSLAAARASLSTGDKKALLEKVLRSPQFHQSLTSLTLAIKDGGLPNVADALGVKVANGGYIRGGGMPLGGDGAIKTFVEGVKKTVEDEQQ